MKKWILVAMLLVVTGCSSHNAIRQPDLLYDLNAQQNKVAQNGMELLVKPIHLKSEMTAYFDNDLIKKGILPVQVAMSNKNETLINFSNDGICLLNAAGDRCPVMPIQTVVEKTKKSYWRSAGWGVAFGVFGFIPSAINVSNTNEKIKADLEARMLKCGDMAAGAVTEGLVFFQVPKDIDTLDDWKFAISFKNPSKEDIESIEYGMSGKIEFREPENVEAGSSEEEG